MTLEDYNNSSPTFQSFVSVVEDDGENPQFFVSAGAHFRGYHLFFNSDLTYHSDYFNGRARITHQIHPQNKVHVYLSRMNDSIENGAFVDFVKKGIHCDKSYGSNSCSQKSVLAGRNNQNAT